MWCVGTEAIPIPADQPIMQIRDLDDVIIPTMEIKVQNIFVIAPEPKYQRCMDKSTVEPRHVNAFPYEFSPFSSAYEAFFGIRTNPRHQHRPSACVQILGEFSGMFFVNRSGGLLYF